MITVLISVLSMIGLGIFFAAVLAFVNKKFKIDEDVRISKITNILPGANCGACGLGGCHAFAQEAVSRKGAVRCPAVGSDVSEKIASILGVEFNEDESTLVFVNCGALEHQRKKRANYIGIRSCQAVELLGGGDIECSFGCLGYGDCKNACPFGAIVIKDGLPEIIVNKCTKCGNCAKACPRNIITVKSFDKRYKRPVFVKCSSKDKGAVVRKICEVGCVGCGICVKACEEGVFEVKDNLARVNYLKAAESQEINKAVERCPTKCIVEVK